MTVTWPPARSAAAKPRSPARPESGAATAPAAPTSAKIAMPRGGRSKGEAARRSATVVQNRLNAAIGKLEVKARRRSTGSARNSVASEAMSAP